MTEINKHVIDAGRTFDFGMSAVHNVDKIAGAIEAVDAIGRGAMVFASEAFDWAKTPN